MRHPYVITISSEKGGVGKTTIALNLAIFMKALREDLPVTLLSFDNHFSVDRMFRIGKKQQTGNVGDLYAGRLPETLLEMGEFGVQFIPSSRDLSPIKNGLKSPMALAAALSKSSLGGVLIIDTRPDLDMFTQNALCAADRIIVPVKDTPSLENCRHLFEFTDQQHIPRHRLRVLPCLIDFRIQYDGPFKNPHQLMKAFAINRGYKCMDHFISKSPKVESLNTNPEGKIFPVLTYGRGTDVHQQFTSLSESLLHDLDATQKPRLVEVAETIDKEQCERLHSYQVRLERLHKPCPCCNETLVDHDGVHQGAAFYLENSTGSFTAFLHEKCVSRMFLARFYGHDTESIPEAMQELLQETYRRGYFVLKRTPGTRGYVVPQISLYRFDDSGLENSRQDTSLDNKTCFDGFTDLLKLAMSSTDGAERDLFILLKRVSKDMPDSVLMPENYKAIEQVFDRISRQFPRS